MTKEIDVTKYRLTAVLQILAVLGLAVLLVLALLLEKEKPHLFIYVAGALAAVFLNRYLHEAAHYAVGRLQGFKCEMKFGIKISECRVFGAQTYKQVVALSLAPLYVYIPVTVLVLLSGAPISLKLVYTAILSLFIGGMAGDFIYVAEALKNKGGRFTDNGHVLVIEQRGAADNENISS